MRFPSFELARADGAGTLSSEDLDGAPWVAYMARHPGCFVCQEHLTRALEHRPAVQALGGDIVVFFNSQLEYTQMWFARSDLPRDLPVVIDPDASLYEAVGTIRGGFVSQMARAGGSLWRARRSIRKWKLSATNDMMRMGADAAVGPDGEIALLHICADPEDREPPARVLDALRQTVPA